MTLHERLKAILKGACTMATGGVFEVFMAFDTRTSTYRMNTPAVIFRLEEIIDRGFGLYKLTVRIDLLGKASEVETMYKAISAAFSAEIDGGGWSVSLASGSLKEVWDTDLNVDWGTMTLKGVAIEKRSA